jgi:AraC family transcriptional regulator
MKVMVIVKASKASEAGEMPPPEMFAAMGKFNEELINAGIMVVGGGLAQSSRGARVRFSGSNRTVTDGLFPETKELVAGFWIWKVSSLQEAIGWVKKCPNPMIEDSDIEIRPFIEPEDLAAAIDPVTEEETRLKVRARMINWTP